MSEKQRSADRLEFEEKILFELHAQNWFAHELARMRSTSHEHMQGALRRLEADGRVQRLNSGAWALTLCERNRRSKREVLQGYIPAPPYKTPDVGWWG